MKIVLIWWLVVLFLGLSCLPLTWFIFRRFEDCGWLFSKTLGLFFTAWILWSLNCSGWMMFIQENIIIVLALFTALNYGLLIFFSYHNRSRRGSLPDRLFASRNLIIAEELLFFALFSLSVWIVGFKPEAYGTEKFMDYGFITSMIRSLDMPFADMWYSGKAVNYYYGGQYVAAFLIKLTGVTAGEGYNLMRALVTTASFMLPFSLVYQLLRDRLACPDAARLFSVSAHENAAARTPFLGGLLGGCASAFCGNFHYVIYGIILPVVNRIRGTEYSYWFPDTTRYIGFDPDLPDKTIHEFPAYSSVLGDLHAHYLNILFVVTVTAVVYAWAQKRVEAYCGRAAEPRTDRSGDGGAEAAEPEDAPMEAAEPADIEMKAAERADAPMEAAEAAGAVAACKTDPEERPAEAGSACKPDPEERPAGKEKGHRALRDWFEAAFCPEVLLVGIMTGVFRWTNFWDFPIYYVVCGSIFFFVLLGEWRDRLVLFAATMLTIAAVMFGAGVVASWPFTATFFQISSEVAFTHSHSLFYQLLILWGLPAACLIGFILSLAGERRGRTHMALPDLAVLMYGLCAAGLVFLPEVIYVKDIYAGEHYRANTMFKLTYQAFILFAVCMSYILVRSLAKGRRSAYLREETAESSREAREETGESSGEVRTEAEEPSAVRSLRPGWFAALAGLFVLVLTGGYVIQSVYSWFGNVLVPGNRINTDASVFVSEYFPSDYDAVNYLNSEIDGQPVVLEAPGDSYSDYERISVATGLPTVAGWYVHEWLWRQDTEDMNERLADIEKIYMCGTTDPAEVRELIGKYGISYLYIGSLEREKYPDLDDEALKKLGETVFEKDETFIVEVGQ